MDESIKIKIMSYLHDEMTPADRKSFENEMEKDNTLALEVEELRQTLAILQGVPDEEVIMPSFGESSKAKERNSDIRSNKFTSIIRLTWSIAASISLILLAGYLSGFQIQRLESGVFVGFRHQQPETLSANASAITPAQTRNIVDSTMHVFFTRQAQSGELVTKEMVENQLEMLQSRFARQQTNKIPTEQFNEMLITSKMQQQEYMQEAISEMFLYLDQKYGQQLELLNARIEELELKEDLRHQQTGEILAGIVNQKVVGNYQ